MKEELNTSESESEREREQESGDQKTSFSRPGALALEAITRRDA